MLQNLSSTDIKASNIKNLDHFMFSGKNIIKLELKKIGL